MLFSTLRPGANVGFASELITIVGFVVSEARNRAPSFCLRPTAGVADGDDPQQAQIVRYFE